MVVATSAMAQDPAMYVYRNDGRMNAFLMSQVDSMSYSTIGIDGIRYATPVVQEIWTKDSLYRIPISVIDSISYQTPEPIIKNGVFIIDETNVSYVVGVDFETMKITFSTGTPTNQRPKQGQVIFCDLEEEPFPMGFSGRVTNVETTSSGRVYTCEVVGPEEVYDRLLLVGRIEPNGTHYSSARKKSPRKAHAEPTYTINTTLNNLVTLSGKGAVVLDYFFDINAFNSEPATFYMLMKHDVDLGLSIGIKKSNMTGAYDSPYEPEEKVKEVWGWPVELYSAGVLHIDVNTGAYCSYGGEFSLDLSGLKYKYTNIREFTWCSDNPRHIGHKNLYDEGKWADFEDNVKLKAELAGKVSVGVCAELAAVIWKPNWMYLSLGFKIGPELKGSISVDTDLLKSSSLETALYKELSENVKLTLGVKVGADLKARYKEDKKEWTILSGSATLFPQTVTLVPKLTKPRLPQIFNIGSNRYYIESSFDGNRNPLSVKTTAKNVVLFPGPIGLEIRNSTGNVLYSQTGEGFENWHWVHDNSFSSPSLSSYTPQELTVYPQFKMFGLIPMKAEPATITVPKPLKLSKKSLTVGEGKNAEIICEGGWDYLQVDTKNESIASASLKKKSDNTRYIDVIGLCEGQTTVNVQDVRSGIIQSCNVKVNETPIELSANQLQMVTGENRIVTVIPKRPYQVESSNPSVAAAVIGMTNGYLLHSSILISAKQPGTATIYVKDNMRNRTETIEVSVREALPAAMTIEPMVLDYGRLLPDEHKEKYFKVTNTGEKELVFKIGELAAPFSMDEAGQQFSLSMGESMRFWVTCSNMQQGTEASIQLPIESNCPTGTITLTLKARGKLAEDIPAEAIDLGLPSGTKWAAYNVGALSPEEPGGYYAWGEIEEKNEYNWETYKHCDGNEATTRDIGSSIGMTDCDVAHVRWGGNWRMPSSDDFWELKRKCSCKWMQLNGQWGMQFTGPNGNSIFMPAAGYNYWDLNAINVEGYYWSDTAGDESTQAEFLRFDKDGTTNSLWLWDKCVGQTVRPVMTGDNSEEPSNADDYVKGICSDFFPENNTILETTSVYVGCKVKFPWNGEMIMRFTISEHPSMNPVIEVHKCSILGEGGSVRDCSTSFSDLISNKKYYWQVHYVDFENEIINKCSPVMSFTTGAE